MKKAKKAAIEDKKVEKSAGSSPKANSAPNPEPNHSAQNGNGSDAKAIKALSKEVKSQGKLLKEMQKELKALSSHFGVK